MKIGYIILCHKEPKLVEKIVNRLTVDTENIAVIHVDKKVDILPFQTRLEENKKAIFLEKRTDIYWGGFSSIIATIDCLRRALDEECDRYVLIQGMDYPLHSNKYIDEFFDNNRGIEFLRAYNVTNSKRKINYMKCYGYHIFDGVNRRKKALKTFIARGFSAINKLGVKYRKGYFFDKNENKRYDIYWGWGHFSLTRECVKYLIEFYDKNPKFNNYFKTIFPADETYFQTIVYNSPFSLKTLDKGPVLENENLSVKDMLNLTYFEYPNRVRIFKKRCELEKIDYTKYLYVRKVTYESAELLDKICEKNNRNGVI